VYTSALAGVVTDAQASAAISERMSFRRQGARGNARTKYVFMGFSSLGIAGSVQEFGCRPATSRNPPSPEDRHEEPLMTDDPALVKCA
jgi:hypothetical protein